MTKTTRITPSDGHSNPSLADVRARRAEIADLIAALQIEDMELANAEATLLRFAGSSASMAASMPSSNETPASPPSIADATLTPPAPSAAPANIAPPHVPALGQDESDASEAVDDDDGLDLVEAIRSTVTGNENLEELIALLMDQSSDTWWTADEVQFYLSQIRGQDVPMRSITLILDRMMDKRRLTRNGHKLALSPRATKVDF